MSYSAGNYWPGVWTMDGPRNGPRAPEPAPVTTIAWRIGHIGETLTSFAGRLSATGSQAR